MDDRAPGGARRPVRGRSGASCGPRSTASADAELDRRPADGGWTPREVVHHVADSEMTSAIRLRRLIAEDEPLIVGYDGDEFARRLHYADRPIDPALAAVEAARRRRPRSSHGLTEAEWARTGTHTRVRPVRRRALARDLRRPLPRARRPDPRRPGRGTRGAVPGGLTPPSEPPIPCGHLKMHPTPRHAGPDRVRDRPPARDDLARRRRPS